MTGTANNGAPTRMEIGLVLQGGGALGAYEWGAINALFDVIDEAIANGGDITLRGVTGGSIAPINALWGDFMIDLPYLPASASRDLALYNVPHFYAYRSD